MKKYFLIGIGGFLWAISRYLIKSIPLSGYHGSLPINTLIINVTGSFLLAFIFTTAIEIRGFDPDLRLGICAGFIGAYTTFSTMCKEAVTLFAKGDYYSSFIYIAVSLILGLVSIYFGFVLARKFRNNFQNSKEEEYRIFERDVD